MIDEEDIRFLPNFQRRRRRKVVQDDIFELEKLLCSEPEHERTESVRLAGEQSAGLDTSPEGTDYCSGTDALSQCDQESVANEISNHGPKVCLICKDTTSVTIRYGVKSCLPCARFFANICRYFLARAPTQCISGKNDCKITKLNRRDCPRCRLALCLKLGMSNFSLVELPPIFDYDYPRTVNETTQGDEGSNLTAEVQDDETDIDSDNSREPGKSCSQEVFLNNDSSSKKHRDVTTLGFSGWLYGDFSDIKPNSKPRKNFADETSTIKEFLLHCQLGSCPYDHQSSSKKSSAHNLEPLETILVYSLSVSYVQRKTDVSVPEIQKTKSSRKAAARQLLESEAKMLFTVHARQALIDRRPMFKRAKRLCLSVTKPSEKISPIAPGEDCDDPGDSDIEILN